MYIYNDLGYIDMEKIIDMKETFIFVTAGRGTGKTYGALETVIKRNIPTLFLRRTQAQLDTINKRDFAPIKPVCDDNNIDFACESINKNCAGYYIGESKTPLIITAALSTLSNLRGFDASDREIIIYDEFIPERHEKAIRNESDAFLNAYETINRNRELKGKPPVKVVCLANSNDIMNPIYTGLRLIDTAAKMLENRTEVYRDNKRGLALIMPQHSPISDSKQQTALYRLAGDGDFADMALKNVFANAQSEFIAKKPLIEYRLKYQVGELCIYKHKSNGTYYASLHASGTPEKRYPSSEEGYSMARREIATTAVQYYRQKIYFENIYSQALFFKVFI
nr:MAG TPA: Terminase [Caudoviricetes sp.]